MEIDPAGAIPTAFALAQAWEWDTDGDLESWIVNAGFNLDAATPTGGSIKGTAATGDPNMTSPVTTISTAYRVIVEFRIKKESSDASRIDLFWDDASGGIAASRSCSISGATFGADDNFKVVRITFPHGKINSQLDKLRLDPIADPANVGKSTEIDYLRVYTESLIPLEWDTDTLTAGAQGGDGTWDQTSNSLWWDGAANTQWPGTQTDIATFGGTAGEVTVASGVSAGAAQFDITGYTLTGNPITLLNDSALFKNASQEVITRIESQLVGNIPVTLQGGIFVLGGTNTSLTGAVTQASFYLGITNNDALGSGTYTAGAGGNTYIAALDGDRTLANDVIFAGNRMIIEDSDLETGLARGNLTIDGNLALNCVSPGDLYLRKNLTVNGIISGSNSGVGLLLAGNAGTLTLTNTNTFTAGIKWNVSTIVEASSDAALGDAANTLNFNAGSGALRALASFSSAREININGATTGKIDTNGFDLELSGTITGTSSGVAQTTLQKVGPGKLTLSGSGTVLYGGFRVDEGTLDISAGGITATQWNGSYGVGGGAVCNITGGTVNSTQYFAVGNGVTPTNEAVFDVNGGGFISGLELLVGQKGNGRFILSSGIATLNLLSFGDGIDASRTATIDLNGGILNVNRTNRRPGSATATINFDGTSIVAKSDQADFLRGTPADTTYNVKSGGVNISTNGFNLTILQPLVAGSVSGGLTKNGAGTLTLNATNTYTGTTTVNAGVLSVNGDSIANSGKVNIAGGKVLIPASTNEVVDTLFYNGVQQPAGVYGSSASQATNQNDDYFDVDGSGTLTVNTGPTNTFAAWISANPPATGFTTDSDKDGISNGLEHVLGTNPNVHSAGLTEISATTTSVTFRHTLNPTIASDVSYTYEWSSDLSEWNASGVANTAGTIGTIVASAPASDVVTVVTTRSGTPSSKLFIRIRASNP